MKKITKILLIAAALLIVVGCVIGYYAYQMVYAPNISVRDAQYLYIHNGADFEQVKKDLYANFYVDDKASFERVADLKHYADNIKPGRYRIKKSMSNNELINMLRSGAQEPVQLRINNIRTVPQLCGKVASQIDIDSAVLNDLLVDGEVLRKYGFDLKTCVAMFIPDTYEMYWNTTERGFVDKMYTNYNSFWSEERQKKAKALNLSRIQVATLASIVQCEQSVHREEQPTIAGLYLNRLRIGMALQSDPTVVFAIGDFSVRRVTGAMLEVDSPYNTYKHTGLPPSPITFPEKTALDAVLDYDHNDYIYMCAKADFSGKHSFAKTYAQHLQNAKEYRKALDKRGIK
ncbi:MAG: endolytic transglycosylase MltG [Bacteroidales bacterium]|nr:endolytic transglycosylase MltG [Bacteroidales bacterium]